MTQAIRRPLRPLVEFLKTESSGGALLALGTLLALLWANFGVASYEAFWTAPLTTGSSALPADGRHWVNDALMALFFLVVGLEIKRELVDGELRERRRAVLPIAAAFGGMIVPALVYLAIASRDPAAVRGWGIPMATDIAFAIGALSVLGTRVPTGLKVFLLSLAIVDDIGAIAVIALFYGGEISLPWLAVGAAALGVYVALWRWPGGRVAAVLLLAAALATWFAIHASGIHATIAGVALGLAAPAGKRPDPSPTERMEHALHPLTSYAIVPLFALANAGVALDLGSLRDAASSPVGLGVFAGLVAGKIVGIAGASFVALRLRAATLAPDVTARHILGAAALGGIGFTVSLFVTQLAFGDGAEVAAAKVGVLAGSALSAAIGVAILAGAPRGSANPARLR